MNEFNHDFNDLTPVESYVAPELPMLGEKTRSYLKNCRRDGRKMSR
jgi:hypothetical protein